MDVKAKEYEVQSKQAFVPAAASIFFATLLGKQCSVRDILEINKTETQLVVATAKEITVHCVRRIVARGK